MTIRQETCPACAAPITVPTDGARMRCPFCNTSLTIERDGGSIGLELAEQMADQMTGRITDHVTETVERTGAQTLSELERMHLQHELSNRRLHLAQLESEIRALERMRIDGTVRAQLRDLRGQQAAVVQEIADLNQQLDPDGEISTSPGIDMPAQNRPLFQRWLWMLFSLSGRSTRMEFWGGILAVALLFFLISLLNDASEAGTGSTAGSTTMEPLSALLFLCLLWISLATHIKRLRARGQPFWWLALWFLPLLGSVWLLVQLGVLDERG